MMTPEAAGRDAGRPATGRPATPGPARLTGEQQAIVDWGDGPLVVIAAAGTGKTRVIVERVRRLLEDVEDVAGASPRSPLPVEAGRAVLGPDAPFGGPLLPEQVLVLTYNVKAARELGERFEAALGPAVRSRLAVSNFHAFCNRVLIESAADAGLPEHPDVLDGVGQVLLLRDLRARLPLRYYAGRGDPTWWLGQLVAFINRAKDELVSPDDFDDFVARELVAYEARFGPIQRAYDRLAGMGTFDSVKPARGAWAWFRVAERASAAGSQGVDPDFAAVVKAADREARRTVSGTGRAVPLAQLDADRRTAADALAATYVTDGAALEVLRLSELGAAYHAYQEELERRGALDFGEQIAAVIRLFRTRPNVLRRWQRQFRYILVDEFQDANIAQIELVELLGRTPDRPANVMVVGDDDQSIYRFRGASYAAFAELDRRFSGPPPHNPGGPAPGPPPRLRLERNFRSRPAILAVANRLIARNALRASPDKRLVANRVGGGPVVLVACAGPDDEAAAVVERIRELAGWDPSVGGSPGIPWSSFAVLYRKHRHRDAILARLREENIPYTVSGGLSLFDAPEVRDLEQSMRAIVDPLADVAVGRVLTAGPWRLDALELLAVTRAARRGEEHLLETVRSAVEEGSLVLDPDRGSTADGDPALGSATGTPGRGTSGATGTAGRGTSGATTAGPADDAADAPEAGAPTRRPTVGVPEQRRVDLGPAVRAKLRRLLTTLDDLTGIANREGPLTVLERFLERTGQLLDLLSVDTLEAKRTVTNIASFLRFAADWQAEHPRGSLAGFVEYLDAFQSAGGELPTTVEPAEDIRGVRLMTVYQAKGLEYAHVFVPCLLEGEWPVREQAGGLFPRDLLREAVPVGDIHTEEERRLLYVAITRAREGLVLTTQTGALATAAPSAFLPELAADAGPELVTVDRVEMTAGRQIDAEESGPGSGAPDGGEPAADRLLRDAVIPDDQEALRAARSAALDRALALPSPRERRSALRLRAAEVLNLLEGVAPDDPEGAGARSALVGELGRIGEAAARAGDQARALGLDPLTLRTVAADAGVGANLLAVAPLPSHFSYSQLDTYERCPLQYAFRHVYRLPARPTSALTFGSAAHAAFEAFTRERRERAARGDPLPTRGDLDRAFAAAWPPDGFADRVTEDGYRARAASLLDNFWTGEIASASEALHEELGFELALDPGDGTPPVLLAGSIDRIDRLPSGGIEVLDYKTGRISSQKGVDESLQLSIYALACRDALGLGTPERVTLYFTESATRMSTVRTDAQLDGARAEILDLAATIRGGDFRATPSALVCGRCDFAAACPSRLRA